MAEEEGFEETVILSKIHEKKVNLHIESMFQNIQRAEYIQS